MRLFLVTIALFVAAFPGLALAQTPSTVDLTVLTGLYEAQLQTPENEWITQRIADERQILRDKVAQEYSTMISSELENLENLGEAELTQAVTQQRQILDSLKQRQQARKVDLDLLTTEENRAYLEPSTATGATEQFRLTKSHGELLARKIELEERLNALQSVIALQEERMGRLQREQLFDQFALAIQIGKYLLILAGIWILERFFRKEVLAKIKNRDRRYTATKLFTATVYTVSILWIIGVLLARQTGILASLAIVGAGLAISLQDVVKDIIGWILVLRNRLYTKGDRITLGQYTGEVIDIGVFRTTLLEIGTTGSEVLERTEKTLAIPNALVLTQPIFNYNTTSDFYKVEFAVTITFESNWRRAKQILEEILEEESKEFSEQDRAQRNARTQLYFIPYETSGPTVYTSIADDGVHFTMRFMAPIGKKRLVIRNMSEKVLDRFNAEPAIEFAYRTSRVIPTTPPGYPKNFNTDGLPGRN